MVAGGDIIYAADMNRALSSRVPIANVADTLSSSAVGTTETIILTLPNTLYKANTAFELRLEGGYTQSVATGVGSYFRVRKGTVAGVVVGDFQRAAELTANNTLAHEFNRRKIFTTLASAITTSLVVTLQCAAGTTTHVGNSQSPRQVYVVEVGDQADYPDAPDLT